MHSIARYIYIGYSEDRLNSVDLTESCFTLGVHNSAQKGLINLPIAQSFRLGSNLLATFRGFPK